LPQNSTDDRALHISDGLTIERPATKLLRFLQAEWELYDGIPIARDDSIQLFDILLSIMMNSRLDTAEKVRAIWNDRTKRAAAERALGRIPPQACLLDDQVPWHDLAELFNSFCTIHYSGPAVGTKILHKKRPALVPIIDSVMSGYFGCCQATIPPNSAPVGERLVANMQCFREQLLGSRPEIDSLCAVAEAQGYAITPVRALEILIWIEREPNGYYRQDTQTA
jgi:hypothetical protein